MRIDPDQHDEATQHYIERINRAVDFVMQHLESSIKLEDVAAVAHISPFHFHRIFKALFGETLNQFIKRVRLERSLYGFQFHLARHPSGVFSKAVSHLHVSGMQPPKP